MTKQEIITEPRNTSLEYPTSYELGLVACRANELKGFNINDGVLDGLIKAINESGDRPINPDLGVARPLALAKVLALAYSPEDLSLFNKLVEEDSPQASFMQSVCDFIITGNPNVASNEEALVNAVSPTIRPPMLVMIDPMTRTAARVAA